MKILKEIKNSPFKYPVKKYYLGKIAFGSPYFSPMYFCSSILKIRKLKLIPEERKKELDKQYSHLKHINRYTNLPLCRRAKDWIVNIFGTNYWIQVGYPVMYHINDLGWKDKYNSPRFEWCPAFYIYFFKWQFCIWWTSPQGQRMNDTYWEMISWWLKYNDKNLEKAEKTWPWHYSESKKSTWDKTYLK